MAEASDLWDFALRLYGRAGVSGACLRLQDESNVDVPILLFGAWLSINHVALSSSDLQGIDEVVASWRDEVIKPVRALRRRLKSGPAPAPSGETESLRTRIKDIEISCERLEISLLETAGRKLIARASADPVSPSHNLVLIVRHFRRTEIDLGAIAALEVLSGAITNQG